MGKLISIYNKIKTKGWFLGDKLSLKNQFVCHGLSINCEKMVKRNKNKINTR